ncbi:MAG TPA: hypothetical protein VJ983_02900 [candidate division Zixibacteria bacterium]|nr:hypothetical protein [candidate division Zixibacteria bacterium]
MKDWLSSGWLKQHATSRKEMSDLLAKVDRDITEAGKEEITLDWRLAIAYNACLGCATIALRASGYRIPGGAGQHYRTIQSLRFTVNPESDIIASLETISRKRAIVSYDAAGTITESEVAEAMSLAEELRVGLLAWLRQVHPELMQE